MKYVKKPIIVDAILWEDDEKSYLSILELGAKPYITVESDGSLFVQTLEGRMKCPIGNWFIKGIKGEYYSIAPDIFDMSYDRI